MAKNSWKNLYRLFIVLAILFAIWFVYVTFRRYSLKEGQTTKSPIFLISTYDEEKGTIKDNKDNTYTIDKDGSILDEDGNDTGYEIIEMDQETDGTTGADETDETTGADETDETAVADETDETTTRGAASTHPNIYPSGNIIFFKYSKGKSNGKSNGKLKVKLKDE